MVPVLVSMEERASTTVQFTEGPKNDRPDTLSSPDRTFRDRFPVVQRSSGAVGVVAQPDVSIALREKKDDQRSPLVQSGDDEVPPDVTGSYRLYKRRWTGVFALFFLQTVASMSTPWFGPISNKVVYDFGFTLGQVGWLGNIVACIFLVSAPLVPIGLSRFGIYRCCLLGSVTLVLSAWIRYAAVARSLPVHGSYALMLIGQMFAASTQTIVQVVAPRYSEVWFDLKGRLTATMIISIANPIGGAVGQLLSPVFDDTRTSLLALGIISTAVTPVVFLVLEKPPSPPTYAGSRESPSAFSLIKAWVGRECATEAHMTKQERIDFALLAYVFAALAAPINTFGVLSSQWLSPEGYTDDTNGFIGATLLLSGIVAALVTAPLFDRFATHHLGLTMRILCPIIGAACLSLIWAVRPNNAGAIYAIMAIIGAASITLLPVGLELGCEITRNADGSSAVMWFFAKLVTIISLQSQSALRASSTASPALNMHQAIIFNGTWVFASSWLVFLFKGRQARREWDEGALRAAEVPMEAPSVENHSEGAS